ncbi:wax ester/triacylglycerol synthase domain-containing protein [Mycobacterium uberis]|uniref:wax ester/triacylglycerol synthase domain-containing protein n=1 Tax=Mycobacterium uberis TaxID=2162698 RepID=UPI00311EACD8
MRLIRTVASVPLDRSRPLWKMYFVKGLASSQITVVGKIHRILVDGVSVANLMTVAMDRLPSP